MRWKRTSEHEGCSAINCFSLLSAQSREPGDIKKKYPVKPPIAKVKKDGWGNKEKNWACPNPLLQASSAAPEKKNVLQRRQLFAWARDDGGDRREGRSWKIMV